MKIKDKILYFLRNHRKFMLYGLCITTGVLYGVIYEANEDCIDNLDYENQLLLKEIEFLKNNH